jgi:hypothetical protein
MTAVTPDRDDRPDEEEGSAGLGDFAADTLPGHVEDGDDQPKERPEEYYAGELTGTAQRPIVLWGRSALNARRDRCTEL